MIVDKTAPRRRRYRANEMFKLKFHLKLTIADRLSKPIHSVNQTERSHNAIWLRWNSSPILWISFVALLSHYSRATLTQHIFPRIIRYTQKTSSTTTNSTVLSYGEWAIIIASRRAREMYTKFPLNFGFAILIFRLKFLKLYMQTRFIHLHNSITIPAFLMSTDLMLSPPSPRSAEISKPITYHRNNVLKSYLFLPY